MKKFLGIIFVLSLLLCGVFSHNDDDYEEPEDVELQVVSYGSVITLANLESGYKLHSHEINYGGGSGQQSVTGFPGVADPNSLWLVLAPHSQTNKQGKPIRHGDKIRLQHISTGRNLHSHAHFKAPISTDGFEVSAYGQNGVGDTGDNWVVEVVDEKRSAGFWKRGEKIRLKHDEVGGYLYSNTQHQFSNPIRGQLEVKTTTSGASKFQKLPSVMWATQEGVYFEATLTKDEIAKLRAK